MSRRGIGLLCRVGLPLVGAALAALPLCAQNLPAQSPDELRLEEIRRAFWALTDAAAELSAPGATAEPDAVTVARLRVVPALCREFLLDFPASKHAVRVRWLVGRAWALSRRDGTRAAAALEGAVIAHLNARGVGQGALAQQLAALGITTPRAEGDWQATTQDVDHDGAADVVLSYRFAGPCAEAGGFCSLFRRQGQQWAAERLFGPRPALASSMADAPMGPHGHQVRDLNGDGSYEILLPCRTPDLEQGLLLVFGLRNRQWQRLLWADCPDGAYEIGSVVDGWPQIIIVRRFGTPEDSPESFRRRERHYFGFDGQRYAFVRTLRDAPAYLYEQFWDARLTYDSDDFERAAPMLGRVASDDALKTRLRAGAAGEPSRPSRFRSEADEQDAYRATALYLAGLAWAHAGELARARQAMADAARQYTYTEGVSAHGAQLLPAFWARRFSARYNRPTDLYVAMAQVAPAYALLLYLADHAPEDPPTAILNSGVHTEQALVTDVTGDDAADIIVGLPRATGPGRMVVVFVSTSKGWDGYAIAGDAEIRAEQDRGAPRGAIAMCGLSGPGGVNLSDPERDWVVGQVADFNGDGVKDMEIKARQAAQVAWSGRQFGLVSLTKPSGPTSDASASAAQARKRDLASLDQIEDAIYDHRKFEPSLAWLDTLDARLRQWEDAARARALLAEVAFHRGLCHAHLNRWEQASRSYNAVTSRYPDLAWATVAESRAHLPQ